MPTVTSKDDTTIKYVVKGSGPVLILVLGAMNKRGSGKKLAEQLADRFTVVCYDRRGRGDSTDIQPYDTGKEVDDLEALIDGVGGSAYLYGHSSGAILALLAVEKLGSKVKGMVLYEVPINDEATAQDAAAAYRKQLSKLLAEDKRDDAFALFLNMVGVSDKQTEAMKRLPMWKGLTAMAPTLAYDTIELVVQYPKINLKAITTPALVTYGADSPAFMGETAKKLSEALPDARLRALEGQAHDVKADAVAPVIAEYL
jgi:pimeloyl-ACP methyl ester carboxylesterase